MKIGVLAADGFQDSEYFLPKIEIEQLGVETKVISLRREPIEIHSLFGDSGEAERSFRREAERHSGMIPNTIGA